VAQRTITLVFNDKDSEAQMARLTRRIDALAKAFTGLSALAAPVAQHITRITNASANADNITTMANAIKSLGTGAGRVPAIIGRIADQVARLGSASKLARQDILDVVQGIQTLVTTAQSVTSTSAKPITGLVRGAIRGASGARRPIRGGPAVTGAVIDQAGQSARRSSSSMLGFATHSERVSRALLHIQSAASGMMLANGILNRQLSQVLMNFLFLRFSEVPVVAVTALLSLTMLGLQRILVKVGTAATAAGMAFESSGQQMASFLQSAKKAMDIKLEASKLSRETGMARADLEKTAMMLERFGLNTQEYMTGLMNIAAGTGTELKAVSDDYLAILRADGDQQANMVKQFVRNYDLPAKAYTNTLDMMTAANERYKGAAALAADTTQGWWNRLKASAGSLMQSVGIIMNEIIKPVLQGLFTFFEGAIQGFNEMFAAGSKSGRLKDALDSLKNSMQRLLPYITEMGRIFGKFLYYAVIGLARVMKVLFDVLRGGARWIKEHKNLFVGLWNVIKGLAGYIWDGIIKAFDGLKKIIKEHVIPAVQELWKALDALMQPLNNLWNWITTKIIPALGDMANELVNLGRNFTRIWSTIVTGMGPLWESLTRLYDALGGDKGIGFVVRVLAETIVNTLINALENLLNVFNTLLLLVNLSLMIAFTVLTTAINVLATAIDLAKDAVVGLWNVLNRVWDDPWGIILSAAGTVESAIWLVWQRLVDIKDVAIDMADGAGAGLFDWINRAAGYVEDAFWWAGKRLNDLYDLVRNPPNPVGWLGSLLGVAGDAVRRLGRFTGLTETFGGTIPSYATMGTVPGRLGTRKLVLAEAGEHFLGAPGFANSRALSYGGGTGGAQVVNIAIDMTGSVVTGSNAMDDLSNKVAGRIVDRLGAGRKMSFHRV